MMTTGATFLHRFHAKAASFLLAAVLTVSLVAHDAARAAVSTPASCTVDTCGSDEQILANLLRQANSFQQLIGILQWWSFWRENKRALGYAGNGSEVGRAASAGNSGLTVWTAGARAKIETTFQPLRSSGTADTGMVGVDYAFRNDAVAGVSLAPSRTRITTPFNNGSVSSDGMSYMAYGIYPISKAWTLTGGLGHSDSKIKIVDNTLVAGTSQRGERKASGTSWSLGAENTHRRGDWSLAGRGGLSTSRDKQGAFAYTGGTTDAASSSTTTQMSLGVTAAYDGGRFSPIFGLTYLNNLKQQNQNPVGGQAAANDKDAFQLMAGLQWQSPGALFGSVQLSSEQGRKQFKNNQFVINVGLRY